LLFPMVVDILAIVLVISIGFDAHQGLGGEEPVHHGTVETVWKVQLERTIVTLPELVVT